MNDCIFCKIAKKEIEKSFIYEDEDVMAFDDINPVKPVHILVVPKNHIHDLLGLEDDSLKVKILSIIQKIAKEKDLDGKGFRVVANAGGAQAIDHLHFHLMGPMGLKAGWSV